MSTNEPRADRRVALITGASTGIGLHTAVQLASLGWQVVATLRDTSRSDALRKVADEAEVELDIRALDVTDHTQAEQLIAAVTADHGAVDVLVNNAGRGFVGTLEQVSLDDLRAQMELNYLGVARMTQLVLPPMRAKGEGRIVTVTSVGGIVGQPFNDAYCAAKFAAEGLLESLAPVAATFGVHVSVVEPGPVATEFIQNLGDSVGGALSGEYRPLFESYIGRAQASFADAQPAAEVAATVVQACTEAEPRFRYQTSPGSTAFVGLKLGDLDGSAVQSMTRTWIG